MVKAWLRLLLLVSLVVPVAKAAGLPDRTPVVITTDCGADMDDQWAIAHAALSPQLRPLAVIGNFAPAPHHLDSRATTRCARQALEAVGRLADVPVHAGADHALPDRATPVRSPGVEHLIRLSAAFSPERRLVVLAFGPATDIASALLLEPRVAERIAVVALAFDRYPEGGDGWNVRNDVAAWQVLLDAAVPVTTASGYVALDDLNLTRSEAEAMVGGLGAAGGTWPACTRPGSTRSARRSRTRPAAATAGRSGTRRWWRWSSA
jgi:inosine-uridine nucleoside N-ribohydrolase